MEENLTIGSEIPEGQFKEEDVIWDETTACQYADTAQTTLANLCDIDEIVLSKFTELERNYIKKTKKMCIRIMHHYIKDIFTDMLETQENELE